MRTYKIAIVFLTLTCVFAAISISVQAPQVGTIEVEVQEAVYLQSVYEDGKAQIKVTIRNNSPKLLRIRKSSLTSNVVGFQLGKGEQGGVTVKPGTERALKFTIQEDWSQIPLYEPEWQQSYDFFIEILDLKGSRMEFKQIIPTPRCMFTQQHACVVKEPEQVEPDNPFGIEFRVMNVTYPMDYLETAKRPPRHTDYTNVTVEYKIFNHGERDVLIEPVSIISNFGGYELRQ